LGNLRYMLRDGRLGVSPPEDAPGFSEDFFGRDALNFTGLDFFDAPVDLRVPGGFGFRVGGVDVIGETPHEFADLFGRPGANFVEDLVERYWHGVMILGYRAGFNGFGFGGTRCVLREVLIDAQTEVRATWFAVSKVARRFPGTSDPGAKGVNFLCHIPIPFLSECEMRIRVSL
jgi:hypothetical protein